MNPEVKKKWVMALRSGKYPQGRTWLRAPLGGGLYRYCPLGVLCALYVQEGHEWFSWDGGPNDFPNPLVVRWAGLKESDPQLGGRRLTTLNDRDNMTFEQLADVIEEQL